MLKRKETKWDEHTNPYIMPIDFNEQSRPSLQRYCYHVPDTQHDGEVSMASGRLINHVDPIGQEIQLIYSIISYSNVTSRRASFIVF